MTEKQKMKQSLRRSKKWKELRHQKNVEQKGLDPITQKKLSKTANLHHKNLKDEDYCKLDNPDDFVLLNTKTHEAIHWIFTYWKKDKNVLSRIENLLIEMERYI